jgi:hypothetical protein
MEKYATIDEIDDVMLRDAMKRVITLKTAKKLHKVLPKTLTIIKTKYIYEQDDYDGYELTENTGFELKKDCYPAYSLGELIAVINKSDISLDKRLEMRLTKTDKKTEKEVAETIANKIYGVYKQ